MIKKKSPKFQRGYNSVSKIERRAGVRAVLMCFSATDGQGEGGSRVEMDKNSCDRNEECSVRKGLASTSEVCFGSLIRERGGRCSNRVMNSASSCLIAHY